MRPFFLAIVAWLLCLGTAWTADLQQLSGHVPAAAARQAPLGHLDGARHLQLSISLPSRDPDGLKRLIHDLYDPTSPQYRHFLTPDQFTEQFGPTKGSYQALTDFAKANGLAIKMTHSNRLVLSVDGAVTDIEKAFHVTMQVYQHPTEHRQFYAPNQEPSVNLAQPILHVSGLTNYALPRPNLKPRPAGLPGTNSDQVGANSGSGPSGAYGGNDFRAAYVPGTTLTGTGQSVGLLEFDGYYASDITRYETQFSLPNIPLVNVAIDGGVTTVGDGNGEVCLDIEMVIAMAPGVSTIYVYESSGSWIDMLNRMATDNLAKQLSCSWYVPGGAAEPAAETIFQQMATQGQSFFAASGDSDAYTGLIPFPSDSPNITLVGGTTLSTSGAGGAYTSESVWNWGGGEGSSGGVSTNYSLPSWQQGISMTNNLGSTTMRNVPDVALTADNVYVTYDNGSSGPFGGTSCAAPLWAAFTALVNQQAVANGRATVGFLNPTLYSLALGSSYTTDFHDVTTGNNFGPSSGSKFPAVTGYDLATGLGSPTTALITALAGPPDVLVVTGTDLTAKGPAGGPFLPTSTSYTLRNSGTSTLNWTASSSQSWLSVSPASGILTPGATATVSVGPNTAAGSLAVGSYSSTLSVTDVTTGVAQSRPESLTVLGPPNLTVSPSGPLVFSGNVGGPFSPSTVTYTLTNTGAPSLNWTAGKSSSWLTLSSTSGTLAAGASATITASVASNSLPLGSYTDSIVFTNATNGAGNTSISTTLNVTNQVLVPQPPQSTTYSGSVRGYWFTAPASFVITGLQVPTDASSGKQSIAVLKLTGTPPTYPSTTSSFTTLFLTQSNASPGIIPVSIQVNQGDVIGILGYRDEINSYGVAPYSTQILGQPVTFSRFGMQYPLDTTAPQSVWTESATGYLSRVNMYITGSTTTPIITSAFSASGYTGQPFSYQISATNSPTSYNAVGLPAGLSINTTTGLISGTPTTAGTSNVTISATNATGVGTATLAITISSPPPVITSSLTASGTTGVPFSYTITATNSPTSYSATGLPAGLSVNTATGVISGTPTTAGTSNITISATNSGGTASATLVLNVALGRPVITSSLNAVAVLNTAFTYTITASGSPASFNAAGLPAGLSVNTSTGVISGTPTALGTSNVTVGATNSVGTGTATLVLVVSQPAPAITSSTYVTGTTGQAFSYQITASNSPTSYNATGLPSGLTVNTSTGLISGTVSTTGYYYPTITATNAAGTGTAYLTISIVAPPPVITSATTASGTTGVPFSFTVTATNSPYYFYTSGLPAGLTINTSTGVISGTPTTAGTTNATVYAENNTSTGSGNLTITIALGTPTITSAQSATAALTSSFSYYITATGSPTSYSATGLPPGLLLNTTTGVISGTPTATGTYNTTIGATNSVGTGTATLVFTVLPTFPPSITSSTYVQGAIGNAFSYAITGTNNPTSYSAGSLPPGLTINTSTGVISGTPTTTGTTYVTVSATNAGGTGTASVEFYITPPPPVITSVLTAAGKVGASFNYTITGTNSPTYYSASGLPVGLSVNTSTGVITGSPLLPGTSNVTISAENSYGTGSATLVITVAPAVPIITSRLNVTAAVNTPFSYTISATNAPTSYSATGLPAGWSLNTSTGVITGTPTTTGTQNILISATNGVGTGTATVALTFAATAPAAASALYYNGVGWVSGGGSALETPANGFTFTATANYDHSVTVYANGPNYLDWEVDAAAPGSVPLVLGPYLGATRYPFQASTSAGFDWSGDGRGDNQELSTFNVLDIQYGPNSTITSFAADFVMFDENVTSSWEIGSIRYNSTVPITYPAPPVIVSSSASTAGPVSETLNAAVNPAGPPTTVNFKYGLTASYGSTTSTQSLLAGVTGSPITATLTGLQPATVYHYQVVATSSWGTSTSADATFNTPNNVPTLSGLALSAGTLTPVFVSSTTSYSASVTHDVSAITVTPTLTDTNASVQVNGVAVALGVASAPINLVVGANTINIAVTAQDGVTTKAYTVTVTRGDAVITTQSGSQTVASGGTATFSVSVTGTGPFTYQWYHNGVLISGATGATYSVNGVSQGDIGSYWVVVTNVYGQTTSTSYTLALSQDVPTMPAWSYGALATLLVLVAARALARKSGNHFGH